MLRKNYFVLLVITSICCSANHLFPQTTNKPNDGWVRASYASYYIEEVVYASYDSPLAEATANIILSAYRDLQPIPDVPLTNLKEADKIKVQLFINKLNELRKNPPAWEDIIKKEESRLVAVDKSTIRPSKYK